MPRNHRNPFHPGERAKEMEEKVTIDEQESKEKFTRQPHADDDDPMLPPKERSKPDARKNDVKRKSTDQNDSEE